MIEAQAASRGKKDPLAWGKDYELRWWFELDSDGTESDINAQIADIQDDLKSTFGVPEPPKDDKDKSDKNGQDDGS